MAGEGGMLVINDERFFDRAEIIREKGTNRPALFRGEVDHYGWVDIGSSFLPSEVISAFLYAQLENLDKVQEKRLKIWNRYLVELSPLEEKGYIKLPKMLEFASNNAHIFYITTNNLNERNRFISHLKTKNIDSVFHYLSLHKSPFYKPYYTGLPLTNSDRYSDTLVRLPLYYELSEKDQEKVLEAIFEFYEKSYIHRNELIAK